MLVTSLVLLAPLQVGSAAQVPALPPKVAAPRGAPPAALAYELSTRGFTQPGFEGGDTELEFADVDDDGHLDIVSIGDHGSPFVNTQQHGVMVWFGDGQGAFTLFQEGDFGYGGVAIGDANNDGLADVAYGMHHDYSSDDFGDQLLEVALGDGTGMAWTPWDDGLATNGETWGMFATDLGDVDSDGWLDVLSNSFGCCAGVHVYRNLTDGSWQQTFGFLNGNSEPFALFGDVDGDGDLDVAVAHSSGNVWLGDGAGDFALADGDLPGTPSTRRGIDLGDVDADGRDELAYVLSGDVRVAAWSAPGTWVDRSAGLPSGFGFSMVQVEDMDLDGHADLVAFGGGRVAVFRGDGGTGWSFAKSLQVGGGGTAVALRAADVDHNGRPDIALIQDESCGLFCSQNRPYFFLEASTPTSLAVELRHPSPGTTWVEGGARVVEWQAAVPQQAPGLVTIELSSTGPAGPWQTLAADVPNDGRQQLIVPPGSAGDGVRLRLSLTAGKTHTVQSGAFRIVRRRAAAGAVRGGLDPGFRSGARPRGRARPESRGVNDAEPIHFGPKDRPLRRDVGYLGALLGELLRELAPEGLYASVEAVRLAARRRRKGDAEAGRELSALLEGLASDPDRAHELVRAFSAYFGVVNMAEQVHRMRRRIDYLRAERPQPGGLRAAALALARRGTTAEEVSRALEELVVEPVFTAHPTEPVRRTLLKKDQRLAQALVERFGEDALEPGAAATLADRVALEIASAWQTDERLPDRPTVADEVEHVLFFLSDVLYRVVPAVHEELECALARAYGRPIPVPRPVVRFASWVGGDMDGNPNVGAHTIRETLARHLELALRRYLGELRDLHEHLSQSRERVGFDAAVLQRLEDYAARLPDELAAIPARYADMPYRQLLWLMTARLERKGRGEAEGYGPPEELRDDLALIEASLARHGGARAGLALVRRALRRVDVFGFHLAALDARQDALVHRRAVEELLGEPGFAERAPAERAARIAAALGGPLRAETARAPETGSARGDARASEPDLSDGTRDALEVFRALAEARRTYGERALGPYVISMAQGPDDALAVLLLARAAGFTEDDAGGAAHPGAGHVPLDVAPLFETVDDLAGGPEVLRTLARDPLYAAHLEARGRRQVVMLGYSDSNKDGGIAASRVGLDRAQERLAATAAELGLRLVLFHGRGGSISRGGSKPRAGVLAAPPGALGGSDGTGGHLRSTEQGEIVGAKFGLRGIAARTLEVSIGALLERTAGGDPARAATDEQRGLADTLARASRERYRALVHEAPDFPALFQGMTPIDVIERLEIGSRPARRREMRGVQDLRAIPWVFAWTQCRAVLPGWFGVGTGLEAAVAEHGLEAVRRAAREWPFLATFSSDVEMVLAKSDLEIAARYAELAGEAGARRFPEIEREHARAVALLLEVLEVPRLLERDPTLRRSIRLRNPYVDPLSFVQVELLARWRAGGREDAGLERVLVQTVRGIARGLRNTG